MVDLNPVEARVLGALIEKEITTPEYYPLSLNALVNACNQKSSRDPVMEVDERGARGALSSLEELGLVRVLADARVSKFEHRVRDGLGATPEARLRRDEVAVMCLLLLRGPQTPAELRVRADRLYAFGDTADVLATLERLSAREEPLTRLLPRQPGAREARWRQLLTGGGEESIDGTTQMARTSEPTTQSARHEANEGLAQQIAALEERVRRLEERLERIEG